MPAVIQSVDYSPLPIWPETGAAVMKAWPKGPVAAHIAYARWRSALIDHAERAWQRIYHNHQHQVRYWVKTQLRLPVDEMTMQTLVDDAFLKMAGTFRRHPEKFADYPHLAALLGLLRCCAQRVVQDYVTSLQQNVPVVTLEAISEPVSEMMPVQSELWARLEGLLQDEKEWIVVTRLLLEETKPRHLYAEQPDLFLDINEINTIRERVKARLQRNHAFRRYLQTMCGR